MFVLTRFLALATIILFTAVSLCSAADSSSSGVFGFGQGYFHPLLSVKTEYSDNYKSTADNEISDWKTTISPGLFIAIPATSKKAFSITSSNAAPGGKGVSSFQDADFKGFQGSLMYNADIVRSHDHQDEDETKHRAQGLLQYAFAGGLTLEASDVYIESSEDYAETSGDVLEKFNSNLVSLIAFYEYSPKLKVRVGYSNFTLEYTSGTDVDYKERTDDQISTYLIYRVLPKTELFVQYDHVDVNYDIDVLADATDQHIFAGVKFDSNARISGHAKLGYGKYEADIAQNDTFKDFIGDASLKYGFGDRSSVTLSAKQIVNVTDDKDYENILHSEIGLALAHKLSHKIGATLSIAYKEEEYRVDNKLSGREDEDIVTGVKLDYTMNDWLKLGANYSYTDRDSNDDSNDYQENSLMFTAKAAF